MTSQTIMKQGAEAKLYRSDFFGRSCIVKERFKKTYRHPTLDSSLTAQRLKSEVRANLRCRMAGLLTPTVYMVNFENSSIYMEEVENAITVREHIATLQKQDPTNANSVLLPLASKMGVILGTMHSNNIIHGDLTTSNMLLQGDPSSLRLYLIDFGLSSFDASAEDKGVDLYVLERAFLSTHPNTEKLFEEILRSYSSSLGNKNQCKEVLDKLEEIRMRGRKRTMVG